MPAYPKQDPLMSLFLYRLGRTAYRRPWAFIVVWLLIAGGVVGLAVQNGGGKISSSVTIDGTQSQDVLDELRAELPAAAGGQGTIVFTVPEGERLDSGERAAGIGKAAADLGQLDIVVDRSAEAAKQAGASQPDASQPGASQSGASQPDAQSYAAGSGSQPTAASGAPTDAPRPLVVGGKPVPGVLVSDDGSVAMLQIQFTEQVQDLPEGSVEQVVDLTEATVDGSGVEVCRASR